MENTFYRLYDKTVRNKAISCEHYLEGNFSNTCKAPRAKVITEEPFIKENVIKLITIGLRGSNIELVKNSDDTQIYYSGQWRYRYLDFSLESS